MFSASAPHGALAIFTLKFIRSSHFLERKNSAFIVTSCLQMKTLLTVSATIELVAALALLCCPSAMTALLLGVPLERPPELIVARIGGAALLALSIACWLARKDSQSRAARGLVGAMLLYNVAVVAILTYGSIGLELHGLALWPVVVLHIAMTIWCIAGLR